MKEARENYGDKVYKRLLTHMAFENIPAYNVLFSLGDIGTKFYIILTGSVSVKIMQKVNEEDSPTLKKKAKDNNSKKALKEVKILV